MFVLAIIEGFASVVLAVAAPRATIVALLLLGTVGLFLLIAHRHRMGRLAADMGGWTAALVPLVALAALAVLSALWSPAPDRSVLAGMTLLALLVVTVVVVLSERVTAARVARACLLGGFAAYGVGLAFVAIEALSGQALMRWAATHIPALQADIGKHTFLSEGTVIGLSEAMANRRTAILTLFTLPALIVVRTFWPDARGRFVAAALAGLAVVAIYGSEHQSSQLAALLAAGVFALAGRWRYLARRLVLAGWIVATLGVLPLVLAIEGAGMDRVASLPESARQRVIIWGTTARATLAAPLFGIGADATPAAPGYRPVKPVSADATTSVHAHNAYLQIWYELGAVGALLLAMTGAALVARFAQATAVLTERVALAQMTVIAALIATSYGIWQPWFLSAIGLAVALTALALRAIDRAPEATATREPRRSAGHA